MISKNCSPALYGLYRIQTLGETEVANQAFPPASQAVQVTPAAILLFPFAFHKIRPLTWNQLNRDDGIKAGALGLRPRPVAAASEPGRSERRGGARPAIALAAMTNAHHQDHQFAALSLLRIHPQGQSRRQGYRRAGRSPQPPAPDQPWRPWLQGVSVPAQLQIRRRELGVANQPLQRQRLGRGPAHWRRRLSPAAARGSGRGHLEDAVIPADGVYWLRALACEKVAEAWGSLWCAWRLRG